jgi:hypothetical protein
MVGLQCLVLVAPYGITIRSYDFLLNSTDKTAERKLRPTGSVIDTRVHCMSPQKDIKRQVFGTGSQWYLIKRIIEKV